MPSKRKANSRSSDPNQSDASEATRRQTKNKVLSNLDRVEIRTTKDKLFRILDKNRPVVNRWKLPLSNLVISLVPGLATLATTNFHDFLGLSKEYWKGVFTVVVFASAVYQLVLLWFAITRKHNSNECVVRQIAGLAPDVDDLDTTLEFHGDADHRSRKRPTVLSSGKVRGSLRRATFKRWIASATLAGKCL
jgi:hypothetical protein